LYDPVVAHRRTMIRSRRSSRCATQTPALLERELRDADAIAFAVVAGTGDSRFPPGLTRTPCRELILSFGPPPLA
jgi:hypothetical protein